MVLRSADSSSPCRNLSVLVLTYNEQLNLPSCLASVRGLNCPLFVIDSGSTDSTRMIAATFGALLVQHGFSTHAKQWEWALRSLPIETEWILALDADQCLTNGLRLELAELFSETDHQSMLNESDGFYINRRQIFRGRWIKHGGTIQNTC
jgi:glycosyltransferase involved in cell wall biosynthesis